ncbi:MAG: hypothetical protein JRH15_11725 [Deltaproteobacteria bacterium]|nr:hypothetical protein [Deltaproteobacteria bacterium]
MKRTIPLLITGISGLVLIVAYFIPAIQKWGEVVSIWFDILAGIAIVLGIGNLLKHHLRKISDRNAGWGYSAVILASLLITLFVGLLKIGVTPNPMYPGYPWSGAYNAQGSGALWIYNAVLNPITGTMYGMLAFYIASAAFRAFRAKNLEAIVLLGTAFIVLLGRTVAGVFLTAWMPDYLPALRLENLTTYIMTLFNTAGNRAIMIGVALGVASASLRVLVGIDRSYLGSGEE